MLQVECRHYASDALEDAMRLAQTKALNSYTFSDCLNHLNYVWSDIYSRMAQIDDGYYGKTIRLTSDLTILPKYVKNTLLVYAAQSPVGYNRTVFRSATNTDLNAAYTYKISGNELYCPDAKRTTVWLYYLPACPQVFFTHHNRDPILHEHGHATHINNIYNIYKLVGTDSNGNTVDITTDSVDTVTKWYFHHRNTSIAYNEDITDKLMVDSDSDGLWKIKYISCDYPYIFVTYEHTVTNEHLSGFYDKDWSFNIYNPFAFTGRNSDVEYLECHWNDKTGMGVIIKDYNDVDELGEPRVKELGWTPDTLLDYPLPEMYRYLVARLADKFSALNESNVMGVQKELVEAKYAFEAFLDRDKSAWKRIINVNPPTLGDYL